MLTDFVLDAHDPLHCLLSLCDELLPYRRRDLELWKYRNPSSHRASILSRRYHCIHQRLALRSYWRTIFQCNPTAVHFCRRFHYCRHDNGRRTSLCFNDAHGAIFLLRIRRGAGLDFKYTSTSCFQACCCVGGYQLR